MTSVNDQDLTMKEAKLLFVGATEKYPGMEKYLSEDCEIVLPQSVAFERAITAVLSGKMVAPGEDEDSIADFATGVGTKRTLAMSILERTQYDGLEIIPPTSNQVERFFSKEKHVLTDYRANLTDDNIEILLYLELHSDLWSVEEIQQIRTGETQLIVVE